MWEVTSGFTAVAAHVVVAPDDDCHGRRRELQAVLRDRFGIHHTTLQVDHAAAPQLLSIDARASGLSSRRSGGLDVLAHDRVAVGADHHVLGIGDLVARHDDEEQGVVAHVAVLVERQRDRTAQSTLPHSQTKSTAPRRRGSGAGRVEPIVDRAEARLVLGDPPLARVQHAVESTGAPDREQRDVVARLAAWSSTARCSTAATISSALAPRSSARTSSSARSPRSGSAPRISVTPSVNSSEQVAGLERDVALAELGRSQPADDRAAQLDALDAAAGAQHGSAAGARRWRA